MNSSEASEFLEIVRSRIVVHLTAQIKICLNVLNDKQIWWRPNESSNAIGNLVLHCAGSTRYYIGHVVGNTDYTRKRESEFSERREITAAELTATLDIAISEADKVITNFDPSRLLEQTSRTPKPTTLMNVLALQLAHFSTHTGQILFATKLLQSDAIDDLWRNTPSQ